MKLRQQLPKITSISYQVIYQVFYLTFGQNFSIDWIFTERQMMHMLKFIHYVKKLFQMANCRSKQ